MPVKNNAVKFDRVSSKDQRDGFSLDAQNRMAESYAKQNNLKIVQSWSVDESASTHRDRKRFFEMISYVKENEIKNVIFDKVDRACRNLESALDIQQLIDNYDVRFHFSRECLVIDKSSSANDKFRFYLGVVMATLSFLTHPLHNIPDT